MVWMVSLEPQSVPGEHLDIGFHHMQRRFRYVSLGSSHAQHAQLCTFCDEVFSKWAQPHMVSVVPLESWDTVGVHVRIHL